MGGKLVLNFSRGLFTVTKPIWKAGVFSFAEIWARSGLVIVTGEDDWCMS